MKKIDIDMIIIIGLCLIFSLFFVTTRCIDTSSDYLGILIKSTDSVTIYRNNDTIVSLPIDEYLIGVVGCEVDASYEIDALKAQAIVSRTYALRSLEIGRKLTDDVNTQCYKDDLELKKKWGSNYDKYYQKVKDAILSTSNLAIYYNDKLIDALYYATSNGYTEDAKNVWGNSVPYLVSVSSTWDKDDKNYKNVISIDLDDFKDILNVKNSNFDITSRDTSGRVLEIIVGNKKFSGVEFRKLLGLKSTDFEIDINNDKVVITTYGYGHGVGLSQNGANHLAKDGYNYEDIIKYYYTGVIIK